MQPLLDEMSINTSAVKDDDVSAIALVIDDLARNPDAPHGAIWKLEGSTATDLGFFEFSIVALTYCHDGLVALGEWGDVRVFSEGDPQEESISFSHGPLRNLTTINGKAFACGADLQVFKRTSKNTWVDIGPGDVMRDEFPACHLEHLEAYSESEIYAAGRSGLIWYFDGSEWLPVQTATNLSYYAVHCGQNGKVYLSGQGGVVAIGRYDSFELLTPPETQDDVWGIALYDGILHMAGFRSLFLTDGEDFIPDTPAFKLGGTFYDLHLSDSYLWSFGMKDVMRRDMDGWNRLQQVEVET